MNICAIESNDSSTATSAAASMTATSAITMMRERCACERLVSTISASMKAEVMISMPQAARENASRIASDMMPNAIALRNDLPNLSETTLCSANSAGRIRNAPSTFGSLKVPRARSYSVSRSCPPGTRLK